MSVVQNLIGLPESLSLDFKVQWHVNKAKLIHDIVALSNARLGHRGPRYLVFGIDDQTRQPQSVAGDQNRRNTAQIYQLLKGKLNRVPRLEVFTEMVSGQEIDCIRIYDLPEKPYFLLQDVVEQGTTIRAGVIFERVGDSNTSVNGTAYDQNIEWMIKERLGLELEPMQRVLFYMKDIGNWEHRYDSNGKQFFFHRLHPEIRVIETDSESDKLTFWYAMSFMDQNTSRTIYTLNYYGTELADILVLSMDGGRLIHVQPEHWVRSINLGTEYVESIYLVEGSLYHSFQQILSKTMQQSSGPQFKGKVSVFDSEAQANRELDQAWLTSTGPFVFYHIKEGQTEEVIAGIRKKVKDYRDKRVPIQHSPEDLVKLLLEKEGIGLKYKLKFRWKLLKIRLAKLWPFDRL